MKIMVRMTFEGGTSFHRLLMAIREDQVILGLAEAIHLEDRNNSLSTH